MTKPQAQLIQEAQWVQEAINQLEDLCNAFSLVIDTPWVSDPNGDAHVHEYLKDVQDDYAETLEVLVEQYHKRY